MTVRGRDLVRRIRPSTWLLIATLAASFAGVWALYPLTFPVRLNGGHDFRLLYAAAQMMRAHQNPYDAAAFLRQLLADGVPAAYGRVPRPAGPAICLPTTFCVGVDSAHIPFLLWGAARLATALARLCLRGYARSDLTLGIRSRSALLRESRKSRPIGCPGCHLTRHPVCDILG